MLELWMIAVFFGIIMIAFSYWALFGDYIHCRVCGKWHDMYDLCEESIK